MSRGEETEAMEYVCSDCLPDYYRGKMDELNQYGTRAFDRYWKHQERNRLVA